MNGWLIALVLIAAWIIGIYTLYRAKKIKDPLSLYGPALMLKTKKGLGLIKKIARRTRFWIYYGNFGVGLSLIIMVAVFLLVLWEAFIATTIPSSQAPSPLQAVGIPGINPVIPLWYGILGLVVAIIIHEFSHGFLIAAQKIKLKSMGILLFIIPIGAFVEPDEEQLMKTRRKKRMRVFAAGPTSNIILALILMVIISLLIGGISPKYDAFYVATNFHDNPNYGTLPVGTVILKINGTPIKTYEDFMNLKAPMPGEIVNVEIYRDRVENVSVYSGVIVTSVLKGYPAYNAGIRPGWIFYSINGSVVRNEKDFFRILNNTRSGEKVPIHLFKPQNKWLNVTVIMGDKYQYFKKYAPQSNKEWYKGKGFLGINAGYLGIGLGDARYLKQLIGNPYENVKSPGDIFRASISYIALPFLGLMPFPKSLQHLYTIPFSGFWILVNSLYWIFWLNLMLGMTNLLPAVPLDGGYIFKDFVTYLSEKLKLKNPRRTGETITMFFSILVLILILWQFIGPRI